MRVISVVTLTAFATTAAIALTGCSSSPTDNSAANAPATSGAPAAGSAPGASPAASCDLPDDHDLIVRYVAPGLEDSASELGETDAAHCTSTLDSLKQTAPTGPGYCTTAAWASDNPGYNPDATPAPPLKHVIEAIGPAC